MANRSVNIQIHRRKITRGANTAKKKLNRVGKVHSVFGKNPYLSQNSLTNSEKTLKTATNSPEARQRIRKKAFAPSER